MLRFPQNRRVMNGPFANSDKLNGAFFRIPVKGVLGTQWLNVIASNEGGWEHVSVTKTVKGHAVTPSWEDMCAVKDEFWEQEDEVFQIHPKRSEYVNLHTNCLHLWRNTNEHLPTPNSDMFLFRSEKEEDK